MACSVFSAKRDTKRKSPINMFSSALPKLPVGSSLVAMVPRTIFRSPRPQPGKFVFNDPKIVLQHYQRRSGRRGHRVFVDAEVIRGGPGHGRESWRAGPGSARLL